MNGGAPLSPAIAFLFIVVLPLGGYLTYLLTVEPDEDLITYLEKGRDPKGEKR